MLANMRKHLSIEVAALDVDGIVDAGQGRARETDGELRAFSTSTQCFVECRRPRQGMAVTPEQEVRTLPGRTESALHVRAVRSPSVTRQERNGRRAIAIECHDLRRKT